MSDIDAKTAWRKILNKDWVSIRKQVDWMSAPLMHDYIARLLGGKPWLEYIRDKHLVPLSASKQTKLDMLSVGCGDGWIEKNLLDAKWPIQEIVCLEYDGALLKKAEENLAGYHTKKSYHFFDFNASSQFDFGKYDVIFFCHSLHHCTDVEGILSFINRSIKDDGLIVGMDYFGPTRLQIDYDVLPVIEELYSYLPRRLKHNLLTNEVKDKFTPQTIDSVRSHDNSEAPRSKDLRSLFFSTFPIVEIKPLGGTILRPLLTYRAGNFKETKEDKAIILLLQFIERKLIETKQIESTDLLFVCKKSHRI